MARDKFHQEVRAALENEGWKITDDHEAVGKYIVYREALKQTGSGRVLYLALPSKVYEAYSKEPIVQAVFNGYDFKIILYQPKSEKITSWIK